jgi:hypothetical protein
MFANYLVNYVGQFTGRKLSHRVPGAHCDDLLNLPDNWMKNIVASGFFLVTLFLAVEEKVTGSKGFAQPKLDTHSNKAPNRSLINKQKVMGLFCSLGFKFRNLSFWGMWRLEST